MDSVSDRTKRRRLNKAVKNFYANCLKESERPTLRAHSGMPRNVTAFRDDATTSFSSDSKLSTTQATEDQYNSLSDLNSSCVFPNESTENVKLNPPAELSRQYFTFSNALKQGWETFLVLRAS